MTKVTNRQIFFILLLTLTSFSIIDISRAMAQSADTGAWFTVLVTSVIFGLIAIVIVYLNNMFKGKMLFDYTTEIMGKPVAYILSLYYFFYFLMIAVFLVLNMAQILHMDFFPKTPVWPFTILSIPVFCYIAYKGIQTVTRMCEIIGILFLIMFTFVHILMVIFGHTRHILPLFNPSKTGQYFSAIKEAIFPFLGIEVLLIIPMSKNNSKKSVKTAFLTILTIGVFYALIVESCIMNIGMDDIVNYNDSVIMAIRNMSLPFFEFFERMDIMFLTIGFLGMYLGISVVFTAMTEYLCKIFSRVKRVVIVIMLGLVALILTLLAGMSDGFSKLVTEVGIYAGLVSCAVIPTVLLVTAKIQKHGKRLKRNGT